MKNFAEFEKQDRRLVILRVLEASSGYTANEHLLDTAVHGFGHVVGRERLRADLSDLSEMGLVSVDVCAGVHIATLTEKGSDVAAGRVQVEGVKRPRPGA